ncbi:MAG: hypothetical protein KME12_15405 [Trichocoleus desertorum ATA4-8-CV12]|jgi:hypothetical protein|nr:hypothetical protein [Trichocoleus desertorum ATA4-8-CV12]
MSDKLPDIPLRSFILIGRKTDGSAETFIYKEVREQSKKQDLWTVLASPALLLRRKARRGHLRLPQALIKNQKQKD